MTKLKTDPKIEVKTDLAKTIGEVIYSEIKTSREKNKARYDRGARNKRLYNQITKWMHIDKTCNVPWAGAADFFVPMIEWTVDAIDAREMNVLFSQEPFLTAVGVESSDIEKAPGVTDFIDTVFREIVKLRQNISYFIKQKKILPFAVLKYDWVQDFEPQIVKEQAYEFIDAEGKEEHLLADDPESEVRQAEMLLQGYQQSEEMVDVWVLKDTEITNAPQLRYINFEDYVYSHFAKRNNRLFWEGDRFYMTPNDMKLKSLQEKFRKQGVDDVLKEVEMNNRSGSDKAISDRQTLRECYWWYGRLPFNKENEIDFTSSEAIEQEVICIIDYLSKALLFISHWDKGRLAYTGDNSSSRVYIRGEFEQTENFEGRSLVDKMYQTQKYANEFYNTLLNNAYLAMQKIFVKKRDMQGDEWEKPDAYPGAMWEENAAGDIRVLEVGDVKSIGLGIQDSLMSFGERISNISLPQTGTTSKGGPTKTKGEIIATIQEGNIGLDKIIQDDHDILRTVCKWTVDYYYENMPPGMERRIRGDNGELMFPTDENMGLYDEKGVSPYWEKDDLAGQFDYIWKGTSLSASKELNIAVSNDLMEKYLPQPMVQGSLLATWDILRRGLEARNIKDWKNILPPKEAIVAEMKKEQVEAQAAEKRNMMGSVESRAAQKLGERGVPQEEAAQLIQKQVKGQNANTQTATR